MADNISVTAGTGTTVATDQVGTVHYQKIKLVDGTTDSENALIVDSGGSAQVALKGNVTLSNSKTFIGLTTTVLGAGESLIGLVTVANNIGITGNVTLSNPNTYIGLTTSTLGAGVATIGSVMFASPMTIGASPNYIGLASVNVGGIAAGANYIGLASVNIGGTLPAIGTGVAWIGLVTVAPINIAGTSRVITTTPIAGNTSGNATIFVPTSKFYITHLLIGSASAVQMTIRSGVTYLVGNASIGVPLTNNGGWVENGSPESPIYVGMANADGFVLGTNTLSPIAGHVSWYEA